METHVFFTNQAVRSLDGLTAFSALPNAPVLPYKESRRRRAFKALAGARATRRHPAPRLTPATTAANPCA